MLTQKCGFPSLTFFPWLWGGAQVAPDEGLGWGRLPPRVMLGPGLEVQWGTQESRNAFGLTFTLADTHGHSQPGHLGAHCAYLLW